MNNLPDEVKCSVCNKQMIKNRDSLFHRYYKCTNIRCNDVVGLPLAQYKEDESSTDFGSGAYKSEINNN